MASQLEVLKRTCYYGSKSWIIFWDKDNKEQVGGWGWGENIVDITRIHSSTLSFNAPPHGRQLQSQIHLPSFLDFKSWDYLDLYLCILTFLSHGQDAHPLPLNISISNSFWIIPHPAPIHTSHTLRNFWLVLGSPLSHEADPRTHTTRPNCE